MAHPGVVFVPLIMIFYAWFFHIGTLHQSTSSPIGMSYRTNYPYSVILIFFIVIVLHCRDNQENTEPSLFDGWSSLVVGNTLLPRVPVINANP